MTPNPAMTKLVTGNAVKGAIERLKEDMENDENEMNEALEEIRKETADEPKNNCLTKQPIAEIVVLRVLTLISYISRKGKAYNLKLNALAIEQTAEIFDWANYSSRENTADDFPENRLLFLKIVALLSISRNRNLPHEFHTQLNIFAESSIYMEGFRCNYVSFQLAMWDDSNRCYDSVAMNNLREVMENGSRRSNEKGPRSRVHFTPQIFEEACRDAGISLTPSTESESNDLLTYDLLFPSGCRMVLAIPMNNPEAMEKK